MAELAPRCCEPTCGLCYPREPAPPAERAHSAALRSDEGALMATKETTWFVRMDEADLWHLAPTPGKVHALCGAPPGAQGWPYATQERPERIHCRWCRKAAQR